MALHLEKKEAVLKRLETMGTDDTLQRYKQSLEQVKVTYAKLDENQLDYVKTANELLDLAQRTLPSNRIEAGQLMFEAQRDVEEYREAGERLDKIRTENDAVTKAAAAAFDATDKAFVALKDGVGSAVQ